MQSRNLGNIEIQGSQANNIKQSATWEQGQKNSVFSVEISSKNWFSTDTEEILATDNRLRQKSVKINKIAEISAKYMKLANILAKNHDWEHVPAIGFFSKKIGLYPDH